MKLTLNTRKTWRLGLVIFAGYTAVLLVNLPSFLYFSSRAEQSPDWGPLTANFAWSFYSWVLLTPAVLWAGNRFRIAGPHLWRNVTIHIVVSILTGAARQLLHNLGLLVVGSMSLAKFGSELVNPPALIRGITGSFITYISVIAIQHSYLYFRESQERAFNLQQAELEMLRMQLQPHFFFNTLNAISALSYRAPDEATRLIARLGDMFRISLQKDKSQEVPLKEELEFLEAFLLIHKTLLGRRLHVEWQIELESLDALVPNMLLQPLVENAIQHGVAPLEAGGTITISAQRRDAELIIEVRDNGRGFTDARPVTGGVGLSNTRARLANLYKGSHEISLERGPEGGATVRIRLPFRELSHGGGDDD